MLPTQRTLIPINIETLTGTSFELLVSPYEQLYSIKRKIERREGIPVSHQHLIWNSNELEDESCLNDYNIEPGTTIKLVLAMRGGPVNTKRVPIDDSLLRDMSEFIESSRDDFGNDLLSSTNKNVTFLVLRDGEQLSFFQVIDGGDGTLSPLSGSLSAQSMYNTRETLTIEHERENDEKRKADDRKTKQTMELIRSKLKTHAKKNILVQPRPTSSSKTNLIQHHRQSIHIETSSNLSTNGDNSSGTSSSDQQHHPLTYSLSTNLFNSYNLNRNQLVHQEDSEADDGEDEDDDEEDEEDEEDEQSHDDDDQQKISSQQPTIFTSRSLSPSLFYHKKYQKTSTKKLFSQEKTTNDTNNNVVIVSSPSINNKNDLNNQIVYNHSRSSPMIELIDDEKILSKTSTRKQTADIQSRNETSLSKTIWTDDDEQINISDEFISGERTSTSQSILFRHQNSSTSTAAVTPIPTLPKVMKKSSLASTTQQFYHPQRKTIKNDQQQSKPSPRPLIPIPLSKYRRISSNVNSSTSKQQTFNGASNISSNDISNTSNSIDTFNENLMLKKRIEILKTPSKQQSPQSTAPSPSLSLNTNVSHSSKKQDIKSLGATPTVPTTSSSLIPLDSTKVTIETIGSKTVSALLRQNATIEPVDTSRGVGRHLVSLLTTATKETGSMKPGYKQPSRDVVIEERYKLDSKLNNPWSNSINNSLSTVSSSVQSNAATIYNSNKLPPVIVNRKSTSKCFLCKKKTGLATTYQCRCGSSFCSEHRYPEAHACAFDYKAEGKRLIERNNPLITAPKLPKI